MNQQKLCKTTNNNNNSKNKQLIYSKTIKSTIDCCRHFGILKKKKKFTSKQIRFNYKFTGFQNTIKIKLLNLQQRKKTCFYKYIIKFINNLVVPMHFLHWRVFG